MLLLHREAMWGKKLAQGSYVNGQWELNPTPFNQIDWVWLLYLAGHLPPVFVYFIHSYIHTFMQNHLVDESMARYLCDEHLSCCLFIHSFIHLSIHCSDPEWLVTHLTLFGLSLSLSLSLRPLSHPTCILNLCLSSPHALSPFLSLSLSLSLSLIPL